MELFSIRIQRTFQLVSTRIGHVKGKFIFPVISMLSLWGYLKGLGV